MVSDEQNLKEEGNVLYKDGNYVGALEKYMEALHISNEKQQKAALHSNMALAHVKLKQWEQAIEDCNKCLDLSPGNLKALFRRAQAFEALEKYDAAFKDAREAYSIDSNDVAIKSLMERLYVKLQEIAKQQSTTLNKIDNMLTIVHNKDAAMDQRVKALNNLLVLSRERAGAEILMKKEAVSIFCQIMKANKGNDEVALVCVRIFGELCRERWENALKVIKTLGLPFMLDLFSSLNEQVITAVQFMIQQIIDALSGVDSKSEKPKPNKELMSRHEKDIDTVMLTLVKSCNSRVISGLGRDAIVELITKNVDYEYLCWGKKVVEHDGLYRLLEVASELPDVKYESSMNITDGTRAKVSLALDRVYYCMDHDKARTEYLEKTMEFINSKLKTGLDIEEKIRAASAIIALLQGPLEAGNYCLAQAGVIEMMLCMANANDDVLQQRVAAEAIIAAASKKDKCTSIASMGMGILKNLYKSPDDGIRVRALVGMCKIGSFGGSDASLRLFSDGASLRLAASCRKYLVNPEKDRSIRRWAAEGLAYLTLDAEVKEDLIDDKPAIQALIDLAKEEKDMVTYGVLTTLCNLTNSYAKPEIIPELIELAKYAKQHIPEEHPLDKKEAVEKRIKTLCESGVTYALVALSSTESKNSKEIIARIFSAMAEQPALRGIMVQQGAAKALLAIGKDTTKDGSRIAAQALARLGITINPEVAFPGQRAIEVIRPLNDLLHPECSALQNFEALMCLTNLALLSDSVRSHIMKQAFPGIEHCMYEDHELLRRAGVQCILNLMQSEEAMDRMLKGERIKFLTLMLDDEDLETRQAAAGALVMLTSVKEEACQLVTTAKDWQELVGSTLTDESADMQYRGVCLLYNLIAFKREIAEQLIGSKLFEVLLALAQLGSFAKTEKIREIAQQALKKAEEWKLIQANTEDNSKNIETLD